jgi:UDP-N-acetylglucosamine:LPS N-acetylglucosamine transferase
MVSDSRLAGQRVLVVSASMGAGHDGCATELARRLSEHGCQVRVVDWLAMPRRQQGVVLRRFYKFMVGRIPWFYQLAMDAWVRAPGFFEWWSGLFRGGYERGLAREVAGFAPDLVLTTFSLSGLALGRMRAEGRLEVPVATYVTDPGAHPYWVARGAGHHFCVLGETAEALRRLGAAGVEVVAPPVKPGFLDPRERTAARAALGLPEEPRIVLVNTGSWGIGASDHMLRRLVSRPGVYPVVICGRDERLRAHVESMGLGRAMAWTDDMPTLLAAGDVLLDNAGGLTCWEALATGLPVVLHRPIPGHGRLNATVLERAGLASRDDVEASLPETLARAQPSPRAKETFAQTPLEQAVAALLRGSQPPTRPGAWLGGPRGTC